MREILVGVMELKIRDEKVNLIDKGERETTLGEK